MAVSNGMLDPGNIIVSQPYYIAGKTGALTVPAAANPIATLQHLGRLDPNTSLIVPSPIRVSAVRLRFLLTSGATGTVGFEIYKGAVTTQHNSGGTTKTPTNRKTTGYPSIAATETNLYISSTGAISGGTFVVDGDPFAMVGIGAAATFGFGESIWKPEDLCPITLEAGQGMEVRVTQALSGVGIFSTVIDFMRQ